MTATNPFIKAAKQQLKARVAFAGPTGSGKTFSALEWATILAAGGGIAVVDTEHGSASLYADRFEFDVLTWAPPYDPAKLADTIKAADKNGYAVFNIDSMSHFWEGEGGTLDIADAAGQRAHGNSFAGWKVATPALRHLIDTMLGCDMHVIGTMRSKMEYILEEDSRGKKIPKKIGMAPVMRQGVEYEFTMVGDIDLEHRITFTKSRCSALADVMVQPGRAAEAAETFMAWLDSGVPPTPAAPAVEYVAVPEAKRRLVQACDGDKERAASMWNGRQSVTVEELDELVAQAYAEAPFGGLDDDSGAVSAPADPAKASPPDGVGVAPTSHEPELVPSHGDGEGEDQPTTGTDAAGDGASPSPTPATTPQMRKINAVAQKLWPKGHAEDTDAYDQRVRTKLNDVLEALSHDRVLSRKDITKADARDLIDALESIEAAAVELIQRSNGEWTLRRAPTQARKGAA